MKSDYRGFRMKTYHEHRFHAVGENAAYIAMDIDGQEYAWAYAIHEYDKPEQFIEMLRNAANAFERAVERLKGNKA